MDAAVAFAESASRLRWEDVPQDAVAATKGFVLDTLGAAFAGSSAEGVSAGLDWIRDTGGKAQSSVLVHGDKLPATAVAMVNGVMCQARDFDPVHEPGVLLPYGPTVAAALAIAEMAEASGRDLLLAVLAGTDMTCRIGGALKSGLGWSRTSTLGVFGATLACANLLKLDRERTTHALGLAYSRAAGNIQTVVDGSLAKRYQGGFTAETGARAALLAARGVTGPVNIFEGRCGFIRLYENGVWDRDAALKDLGRHFEGAQASIKPYPCSREHHGAIAAALRLHAEGVKAADIESITITLPPNAFALSGKLYRKGEPHSMGDAISSAAYAVAVALLHGRVTLEHFAPEAITEAAVGELADRVVLREDKSVADVKALVPQSVAVRLRGGASREAQVDAMPGSPAAPLAPRDLDAKFKSCLAHSVRPLPADAPARIARAVQELDTLRNVRDFGGFA